MARVSLKDVARAAGCSVATASNALRGTGEVARETMRHVRKVADELGYRPNPIVASLATGRFRPPDNDSMAQVVVLHSEKVTTREATIANAHQLGFEPRTVLVNQRSSWHDFLHTWYHQGVVGILFGRVTIPVDFTLEGWSNFSVVATGGFLPEYPGHRVNRDFFWEIQYALDQVQRLGYRRILCALGHHQFELADDAMRESAAYHWDRHRRKKEVALRLWTGEVRELTPLRQEVAAWQPDVLVGLLAHYQYALDSCERKPAFAGLSLHQEGGPLQSLSGFIDGGDEAIAAGFRLLDNLVRHRERGFTQRPLTLLLRSQWREGTSLPEMIRSP